MNDMAGRFWRRSAAVLTIAVAGFSNPTPALGAAGTWGAGRYAYADGVVCRNGQQTSPLAAWSVAGGHRAYLTRSVSSDGRVDSAVPPVPAGGKAQPTVTVSPGAESPSDSDIAAVAYLLDHGGDAAALAAAVLTETDAGAVPPCGPTGAASTALDEARRLAGPYQVTVSAPSGQVHPGTAGAVSATVRNANGDPVAGAQVTFRGSDMALNPARAVTDASGTARTQAIVRHGAPAAVVLTASTSVTTGLLEAAVTATPSVTNPTGASVPAVYPAPATSFSGQASVAVDQTAHPVVSTALDS